MRSIGRPIVVCGASGSGKSTLLHRLIEEYSDCLEFSVSHTTRQPRPGEVNGKDYYFTDLDKMMKAIENDEFIEYTKFSGNFYGTSKKAIEDVQKRGKLCALDLEIEGVKNLKRSDLNPLFIFIKTPDLCSLEERLRRRGTEDEESIADRLTLATQLSNEVDEHYFDLVIINDDLDKAYETFRKFLLPELETARKNLKMKDLTSESSKNKK